MCESVQILCILENFLQNKYLVAKIGFDTAENELRKVWITDFADHMFRSHTDLHCSSIVIQVFRVVFTVASDTTRLSHSMRLVVNRP